MRAWSTRVKEEKDAIPQVIFNNKEFNQKLCDFSELYPGEQEWEAFATVLLSPLHNLAKDNDDANIEFSSQQDVSATWKLSEKMDPERVNSTYTTNYPNAVKLRPESRAW